MALSPEFDTSSAFSVSLSTVSAFCAARSEVCLISCAVTCVSCRAVACLVMVSLCSEVEVPRSSPACLSRRTESCSAPTTCLSFSTMAAKAAASSPISSVEVMSTRCVRSPSRMREVMCVSRFNGLMIWRTSR